MMADDFVRDVLRRIRGVLIGAPAGPNVWDEIERMIRADWGGDRPYVSRHGEQGSAWRSSRDERIRYDYRHGESVALLARRYGLSRQRVHQILAG